MYEVVPDLGGDTIWADLQAAYDDLSRPFQELVGSVSAIYDGSYFCKYGRTTGNDCEPSCR